MVGIEPRGIDLKVWITTFMLVLTYSISAQINEVPPSAKRISNYIDAEGTIIDNEKFKTLLKTNKWKRVMIKDSIKNEYNLKLVEATERDREWNKYRSWINSVVDTPAPSFKITDLKGKVLSSKNTENKVVLLNFWFTTCAPCIKEIPELNELYDNYKNDPRVVFMSISKDNEEKVSEFLKKYPINMPVSVDFQKIIQDFNVKGFPTNIVLSPQGNFVIYASGGYRGIGKMLEREIEESLASK